MYGDTFEYNNIKYRFSVEVSELNNQVGNTVLTKDNIGLFSYTNTMNELTLKGTLEYLDTDGRIDSFIDQQFVYCTITFGKLTPEGDGAIEEDVEDADDGIKMPFFVDNLEILDNTPGNILYRFHLIGSNWMNCLKKLDYTNYKTGKETVMTVIKNLLVQSGFIVDEDSFKISDSASKMNYITGNNDNLYTAIPFLLNKLYFSEEYGFDESLKALVYNEYKDSVAVFDFLHLNKFQGSADVVINQIKQNVDMDNKDDDVNIACMIQKSKSNVMYDNIRSQIYSYSTESNTFSKFDLPTRTILKYYAGGNKNTKYHDFIGTENYYKSQPMWNNHINLYKEQFDNLSKNTGLIVNTDGKAGITPGWIIGISCPTKEELAVTDFAKDVEEYDKCYQAITGYWYVSKATTFINPHKSMFRQSLSLMRSDKVDKQS